MKKITCLIMLMFFTLVSYSQILSTDFEAGLPPGWQITNNGLGVNSPWTISAAGGNTGASCLRVSPLTATPAAPIQQWVITSAVDLTGLINPKVSFYGKTAGGPNQNSRLVIMVSNTNTDLASFTPLETYQDFITGAQNPISPIGGQYGFHQLSLAQYLGDTTVYIAFVMINEGTGKTWFIDDINVFEDCPKATNLGVNAIGANTATATWANPLNAPEFEIDVMLASDNPTTFVADYTSQTTSQVLSNLSPNTEYKYYIRSVCGGNANGTWEGPFVFGTTPNPATLPYSENFEGYNGWQFLNGTQVNKWYVGTATSNGTGKSMYISNNDGVANTYTVNTASTTHSYRDVEIPAGVTQLQVSFDWKAMGESTVDRLRVWLVPNTFVPTAGTQIDNTDGKIQIGGNFNQQSNWTTVNNIVNATAYAGTNARIVFEWRNDGSVGTQPPAAVDNFFVKAITCSAPTNLVLTSVTQNSAVISWTAPTTSVPASYDYFVSQTNTPPADTSVPTGNVAGTTATINDLLPGQSYYVWIRGNCGATNGNSFLLGSLVFNTTQIPALLPYTENFDGTDLVFGFNNGTQVNKWIVGSDTFLSPNNSLYISNNNTANQYTTGSASVTQAYRDIEIPAGSGEIQVSFDWKSVGETGDFDYMRVWLVPVTFMPTPGTQISVANSGGVQIGGIFKQQVAWSNYTSVVNVQAMAGTNRKLVFEWRNDGSGGTQPPAAVDNINVKVITCSAPTNLVLTSVNQNSAVISWTAPATSVPASYDYFVSQTNTPPADADAPIGNVAGTTVTMNDLLPGQTYYVWIRGNCGATNGNSFLVGPLTVNTTQVPAELPYTENFDTPGFVFGFNNGTQVNKWMVGTDTFLSPEKSLYISNNEINNQYTTNTTSVTQAYRDIDIPAGAGELSVTFDWKGMGETNPDYMRVWLVPATFTPTAGTQISVANSGGVQIGGNLNQQLNWTSASYVVNVSNFTNSTRRLVFEWRNDGSVGTQPPAAVDNINVKVITCSAPTNLILTSVNQDTAVVSWTAPTASVPDSYDYFVSQTNTAPTDTTPPTGNVVGTTVTLENLLPGQTYYVWVRGNCGVTNGNSLLNGPLVVNTTQIPAQLPYSENFDTPDFIFGFNNGTQVNKWIVGTDTFLSPGNSLYISNNNVVNQYTTTTSSVTQSFRDIAIPAGAGEIQVSFDWKSVGETGDFDYMRVWLVPITFTPTPGTQISVANSGGVQIGGVFKQQLAWSNYTSVVNVQAMAGTNRKLVFEWRNDGSGGTQPPAAVDNINVKVITCSAPTNAQITNVTQNSAVVSWTAPTTSVPGSYDYFVSQTNTAPSDTAVPTGTVTGTTVTLNNLLPGQTYYVWIRGNCGQTNGNSTLLGPSIVTTIQNPTELPYFENFDSLDFVFGFNNGTQPNKWIVGSDVFVSPNNSLYISNNNINNQYTTSSTSVTHAFRMITLPPIVSDLNLNFDYRGRGESTFDYMKVWLVPATFTPTPGTLITAPNSGGIQVGGLINQIQSFQNLNYEIVVPPALIGQNVKLIFEWRNDGSGGSQPPAAVDNISFTVLTCRVPLNLQINTPCADPTIANVSWTPNGNSTAWEYVVLPENAPQPNTPGTLVNQPMDEVVGLTPGSYYKLWVRTVCGENDKSLWVSKLFKASAGPIMDAEPFCAGPEGIVFPNVHDGLNQPNAVNGNYHCLGSTPNAVWYYLKIEGDGPINFQIIQNTQFDANGNEIGQGLDVDYIAFGPFNTLVEACEEIIIAPGSPNPASMVVGCSYSANAVENFTIPNAQTGQIYALLLTNFNGSPGFIKLVQTNASNENAGSTDCTFLCEVSLGEDVEICTNDDYELTAQISSAGVSDITSIEWFFNGVLMDPAVYNTLTIPVNQSGEYSVIIEKNNCDLTVPITDSVNINFTGPFQGQLPPSFGYCDLDNNGVGIFDLEFFNEQYIHLTDEFFVEFFANHADALSGENPLGSVLETEATTIYVKISKEGFDGCATIKPILLEVIEPLIPVVDFEYLTPTCVNGINSVLPIVPDDFSYGGQFSSTPGLFIDSSTGEIDLDNSIAGEYLITYKYNVPETICGESKSHTSTIRVLDRIGVLIDGYCKEGEFTISAIDVLGTLDFSTTNFEWSKNVESYDKDIAIVTKTGVYSLTVTTKDGCVFSTEINVDDIYCEIPKGVSPNGDGLNDSFVLTNLNVQKIQIFNRNGIEVYSHGQGYTNQWHGQSNKGDELPSGTYFYTIVTPFESFSGWIQLVREIN